MMRSSKLLLQPLRKGLVVGNSLLPGRSTDLFRSRQSRCSSSSLTSPSGPLRPNPFALSQLSARLNSTVLPQNPLSTIDFLRTFATTTSTRREASTKQEEDASLEIPQQAPPVKPQARETAKYEDVDELDHETEERGFGRSEKAAQATQVNLSARLAKDPKDTGKGMGLAETWRLIKIVRPEAGVLGWAFLFLLVSSSISMVIPFSIGKFLDVATSAGSGGSPQLYGYDLTTLYMALAGTLVIGASANYGRILILRIVGERIVTRLRSNLFRRTFVQNAEFFDANRVGDLISRLSSDTVIVGKSITQNLSDGLRSLVSGGAGLTLMAFVSLKLTSILAICFPPVAVSTFIFGRAMRNLSRKIQKNLGTLTKIAEERLGNVRTSQSFAGEMLEVARYNGQVRKIFALGRREAFITATYFSTVIYILPTSSQLLILFRLV